MEGKLFKPMAWTVGFALAGSLLFSIVIAPVLACFSPQREGVGEPSGSLAHQRYSSALSWAIDKRFLTVTVALLSFALTIYLAFGPVIGSEFLPHLDEGAIWARGTLAPSTGPDESRRIAEHARLTLASFPEVTEVVDQIGRPDDGTDWTGFFNTEYYVGLKRKKNGEPSSNKTKSL